MIGDFKKSKVFFFLSEKQTQKDSPDTNEKLLPSVIAQMRMFFYEKL